MFQVWGAEKARKGRRKNQGGFTRRSLRGKKQGNATRILSLIGTALLRKSQEYGLVPSQIVTIAWTQACGPMMVIARKQIHLT